MIFETDPPKFRPITLRIETRDDADKLAAILESVAQNRVNHIPAVVRAAQDIAGAFRAELDKQS